MMQGCLGPCPNSTVQYFCTSSRLFAPQHNIKAIGVTKSYSGIGQLCQFPILIPLPPRQVYLPIPVLLARPSRVLSIQPSSSADE